MPRITAVSYNRKTGQVTVSFDDPSGIDLASLGNSGYFVVRGGKGGKSSGLKVTGFHRMGTQVMFTVSQGRAHPSSLKLQVVSGGIGDVAGNGLDGESNGKFPTGNGRARGATTWGNCRSSSARRGSRARSRAGPRDERLLSRGRRAGRLRASTHW